MGINTNKTNNNMDTMEMHTVKMSDLLHDAKMRNIDMAIEVIHSGCKFLETIVKVNKESTAGLLPGITHLLPSAKDELKRPIYVIFADLFVETEEEAAELKTIVDEVVDSTFNNSGEDVTVDNFVRRLRAILSDGICTFIINKYKE